MQNRFTIYNRRRNRRLLTIKLTLKTPKRDFNELVLQDITNIMSVNLEIIGKLRGNKTDRFDWYFVTISGISDDLISTIVCWHDLGIENVLGLL
jgi:hypothetical protein